MALLDRQKEFTRWLVSGFPDLSLKGLSLKAACAVTGNATQESLVKAVTGPVDHGSDGTLQWRLTRLDGPRGLRGWSTAQGLDWATLKAQAAFFLWELHQDYPALEKDLREAKKSIETLTANICVFYERPSNQEYVKKYRNPKTDDLESLLDRRIDAAKKIYDTMKKDASPTLEATATTGAVAGAGLGGAIVNQLGGDTFQTFLTVGGMALMGLAAYVLAKMRETPTVPVTAPAKPVPVESLADRLAALTTALETVAREVHSLSTQISAIKAETTPLEELADHVDKEPAPAEPGIEGLS